MAKETDYKAVAQQIIEVVGGSENIISVAHCATRLRLIVKNREIIDDKQVEAIDIVKGCFFTAGQYQIILGTGIVNKVYDEVMKLGIPDTGCTACILWNFSRCDSKTVPGIYTDFN